MFAKFELNTVHTSIDPSLKRYVNKKIGGLDKYVPRHSRSSAHVEVHLKESKTKDANGFACEVTLFLPQQTLVVKETAPNLFAAVDIAEAKLKLQLKKYKDRHASGKLHRHLMARFKKRTGS